MRVPLPEQLSSVPAIDNGAMGWATQLVDGLQKIDISALKVGLATVTWPGGIINSNTVQVKHNLPRQARCFFVSARLLGAPGFTAIPAFAIYVGATNQQLAVAANTTDGQVPALNATADFYWAAIL